MEMNSYELYSRFGISRPVYDLAFNISEDMETYMRPVKAIAEERQLLLLEAFHDARISESSFNFKSGYGYNDLGREQTEAVFARAMQAEDALVRIQFSSGTHVLVSCLRGLLHAGDDVLIASGVPYDTLLPTLGRIRLISESDTSELIYSDSLLSLARQGVSVRAIDLDESGKVNLALLESLIQPDTRMIYLQKSRGYSMRPALLSEDIRAVRAMLDKIAPGCIIMVDNCYGEFVERTEPTACGADIIAGSLIKNPGAGIAPSGAYVCGRSDLLDLVGEAVTAVGVGHEIGPSLGFTRDILTGIYFAPQVVAAASSAAIFAALLFQAAGYKVSPLPGETRGDLVQCIELGSETKLKAFCEGIQAAAPVDAHFRPEPSPMPGYNCDIIMASGSFIQGSSIELSADGPLRPPYTAFLQGGLNYWNASLGAMMALEYVLRNDG